MNKNSTTTLDRFVNIVSLPFESVIEISNQTGMKVYIDLVDEKINVLLFIVHN